MLSLFTEQITNWDDWGVPAPKLIADGAVHDKYYFRYMIMEYIIMEYINGKILDEIEDNLSGNDKAKICEKSPIS